jgi:hypothetical protein
MQARWRHGSVVFSVVLLLAIVSAGCLSGNERDDDEGPTTPVVPEGWAARALPHAGDHDHDDRAAHRELSTPNFRVLGWDPLITDHHGTTSGDHLCGAVATEGDRRLAVVHSFGTDVAFVLADVTDPVAPVKLGEFVLKRAHTYDVAITPDGRYVALATNPRTGGSDEGPVDLHTLLRGEAAHAPPALGAVPPRLEWRDACTGAVTVIHEELPLASGVVLVDITDPMAPAFADFEPTPYLGPHSIHAARTGDGTLWILASITNLVHQASYFQFFTIQELPALGAQLAAAGTVEAQYVGADTTTPLTNGHVDGFIQTHPATGEDIAYLANWNGGLIVARIEAPGVVTTIGAWNDYTFNPADPAPSGMTGQIHSTLPLPTLWNGRHYTVVGQEVVSRPAGRPTGQMILMDTTDPTDPVPVARWTLPHDPGQWSGPERPGEALLFSTHYPAVINETLFVSMYHGGVWAVDLGSGHWPELPTIGVFVPDGESPLPPDGDLRLLAHWAPLVLDVVATPEGRLVVWDSLSGVYVVEFDPAMEIPAPEPWTEDAWL